MTARCRCPNGCPLSWRRGQMRASWWTALWRALAERGGICCAFQRPPLVPQLQSPSPFNPGGTRHLFTSPLSSPFSPCHPSQTDRCLIFYHLQSSTHPPGSIFPAAPRSCPQSVTLGLFNLANEHRSATISCQRWLSGLEIDHSQLSNCVAWDCAHAYLCVSIRVSEWNQREGIL